MNTIVGECPSAPWHLWAVGVLTLLWNSIGGFSYTMTRLGQLEALGMGEAEIAFFASYSPIANTFWAMGGWGAITCSVLVLLRSRFAFHAICVAIIGLIGSNYYQYTADVPESLQSAVLPILIWSTPVFLFFYTRSQSQAGVLR